MLSFMKEQGFETLKQSGTDKAASANPPETMPATPAEQYLTVTAHKKQVRKSSYLLGVFFCMGLVCLWIMIKKSTPQTAAAAITEDTKIEALMTQFAGVRSEIFNSMDEIAERFYRFSDVKQVRNNELIKNPFRTERYWGNFWQTTSPKVSDYSPSTETAKQSEQVQLSGPMQLLSIMSTDTGKCCMIDDRILYVGDTIRGFKVQHIGDNFVKLESQGAGTEPNNSKGYFGTELILKLSE